MMFCVGWVININRCISSDVPAPVNRCHRRFPIIYSPICQSDRPKRINIESAPVSKLKLSARHSYRCTGEVNTVGCFTCVIEMTSRDQKVTSHLSRGPDRGGFVHQLNILENQ